ncbi:MAG: hypothetical protein MHM6MM_003958 [Cercozoa sp. M6MM]
MSGSNKSSAEGEATTPPDPLVWALTASRGSPVRIEMRDGTRLSGFFAGAESLKPGQPVMKLKILRPKVELRAGEPPAQLHYEKLVAECERMQQALSLDSSEILVASVSGIPTHRLSRNSGNSGSTRWPKSKSAKNGKVQTDSEIARRLDTASVGSTERELQPFLSADDDSQLVDLDEEARHSRRLRKTDQFAANRDKFGIDAQFPEGDYTSVIDRESDHFKQHSQFAEQVERAVLSKDSSKAHIALAADRTVRDDVETQVAASEDALFSAVAPGAESGIAKAAASGKKQGSYLAALNKNKPKTPTSPKNNDDNDGSRSATDDNDETARRSSRRRKDKHDKKFGAKGKSKKKPKKSKYDEEEQYMLDPNAAEFKFDPNAAEFTPQSFAPLPQHMSQMPMPMMMAPMHALAHPMHAMAHPGGFIPLAQLRQMTPQQQQQMQLMMHAQYGSMPAYVPMQQQQQPQQRSRDRDRD